DRTGGELAAIIETNLVAPMLLTQAALAHLPAGSIVVNVASLAGKVPVPHEAAYSASKAGLRAFSRAADAEMVGHGDVRVVCVNPGPGAPASSGDTAPAPRRVFPRPMSSAGGVAEAVAAAIEPGAAEPAAPAMSGKLATLGYLSPRLFAMLRPLMEKRG